MACFTTIGLSYHFVIGTCRTNRLLSMEKKNVSVCLRHNALCIFVKHYSIGLGRFRFIKRLSYLTYLQIYFQQHAKVNFVSTGRYLAGCLVHPTRWWKSENKNVNFQRTWVSIRTERMSRPITLCRSNDLYYHRYWKTLARGKSWFCSFGCV